MNQTDKNAKTETTMHNLTSGLSRRDFITTVAIATITSLLGTIAATAPSNAAVHCEDMLQLLDHTSSLSRVAHGQIRIRPIHEDYTNEKYVSLQLTLTTEDAHALEGVRLIGSFGETVTDHDGQANLVARLDHIVNLQWEGAKSSDYISSDCDWNLMFTTEIEKNVLRLESVFASQSIDNNRIPSTRCTSGRLRDNNILFPVVVCLLVS
jgi:hypothetical protein